MSLAASRDIKICTEGFLGICQVSAALMRRATVQAGVCRWLERNLNRVALLQSGKHAIDEVLVAEHHLDMIVSFLEQHEHLVPLKDRWVLEHGQTLLRCRPFNYAPRLQIISQPSSSTQHIQ